MMMTIVVGEIKYTFYCKFFYLFRSILYCGLQIYMLLLMFNEEISVHVNICFQIVQHQTVTYEIVPLSPLSLQRLGKWCLIEGSSQLFSFISIHL